MKKALLLCASHNDLGLIKALKKLGYYTIVTGNVKGLCGEKYADEYIMADYSNKELILDIAKSKKIDAICQCCNDYGVYTAAYIAEKLKLSGYDSYENTLILHNKDKFKEFAKKYSISIPEYRSFDDKELAINWIKSANYPLIVKPIDCSAGNGVNKVSDYNKAIEAINVAFDYSRQRKIIIERYIVGQQYGFCTFLVNQKVVAVCSNNEYSIINPYRVEIDTYPADNFNKVANILIEQVEKIASILKLKDGIFHLQYIMDGEEPKIIEVMRRILGNMYSVPANLLNGFDWDYWETRAKCGLSCDEFPLHSRQEGYYAYKTILANSNGIIESINIPKEYEKYLLDVFMLKTKGDVIDNYMKQPVGFMFFIFSSSEEMKKVLIEEYRGDLVQIKNDDLLTD